VGSGFPLGTGEKAISRLSCAGRQPYAPLPINAADARLGSRMAKRWKDSDSASAASASPKIGGGGGRTCQKRTRTRTAQRNGAQLMGSFPKFLVQAFLYPFPFRDSGLDEHYESRRGIPANGLQTSGPQQHVYRRHHSASFKKTSDI
jgi:hypothetical protein